MRPSKLPPHFSPGSDAIFLWKHILGSQWVISARAACNSWQQRSSQFWRRPWVAASYGFIHDFAQANAGNIRSTVGSITISQALVRGLAFYLGNSPSCMSPLLLALFLVSCAGSSRQTHRQLLPVSLTAVSGLVLISLLPWQFPDIRYCGPALIATSIYSGTFLSRIRQSPGLLLKGLAVSILLLTFPNSYRFALLRIHSRVLHGLAHYPEILAPDYPATPNAIRHRRKTGGTTLF